MKEATVIWDDKEVTFKYEVWKSIDFVFANVWDKHGKKHQFHLNIYGNFIRPISVKNWPEGLLVLVEDVLKAETPVLIMDKPGYIWENK